MNSSRVSSKQSSKTALNAGNAMRLNRWLASCGLGSRRSVEELITSGRISLNGQICTFLSSNVSANDEVCLDGKPLSPDKELLYIMLYKPRGYVVSHADEQGRQTVYDLLPPEAKKLNYAGRLDKNSEGLLLLTNDGALINALTHPSFKVEKVYRVDISPALPMRSINQLRQGVDIEGGRSLPAGVFIKSRSEKGMTLKIAIREGRKRQIRQMVEAVGGKVHALKRLQFGPLVLKNLPLGSWRLLSPPEIRALKKITDKGKKP